MYIKIIKEILSYLTKEIKEEIFNNTSRENNTGKQKVKLLVYFQNYAPN
jgi:hypothetical protein